MSGAGAATAVTIDGAAGEGGGQVLRTSLALAAITGRAVRIDNVRARRARPGLQRQHLACVLAAAEVCGAEVKGAVLGSGRVDFAPGPVRAGDYKLDIGTAGSTGLVLQTVLPILLAAPDGAPSRVVITGGTHNPLAPCTDFLQRTFAPLIARMGAGVAIELVRHGFYPAGGGKIAVTITPPARGALSGLALDHDDGAAVARRRARAILARLPTHVGERELGVVRARLGWSADEGAIEAVEAKGPGNALVLELERGGVTEVITAFGEKGVRAEAVAAAACDEAEAHLARGVAVGAHLADQLLVPMALAARAGARSRFVTGPLSLHATTNLATVRAFLDVAIRAEPARARADLVDVRVG